ncbi:MBL fold metallo-hydrolase [Myroides sp. 1354]|uniref:MBL fold metallo-hydrolase n=1 Tax=unclassified Myroides TaxID=2642485 RepID=UPI002575A7A5|nr:MULTISPECIES: MBL fold metallo-hydrolase [unclassified Myroides]MDM1045279.1 MBL fold metallo-hydrolase [Myroides sp. R163-1]MDM1056161.1 MBL fold metallo-hydrolase [Myroides sp. 1354]MDM1069290.1 MBL fold metallo-hydrolase [Myroides sp. 1372]
MQILHFSIQQEINGQFISLFPTVIKTASEVVLIDCGYEETFEQFRSELAKLSIEITDITAIFISHDDIDHLGGLALFLQENPNIKVYSSTIEKPSICGEIKAERLIQAENSLAHLPEDYRPWAESFIAQLKKIKRFPVNQTFNDGDFVLEGLQVIDTPGHTQGHISLLDVANGVLIANDALVVEEGQLNIANPQFTLDLPQAILSVQKIKALQSKKIICYHGGILEINIQEALEKLIQQYS